MGNTPTHVGKTLICFSGGEVNYETPPRTWGRPHFLGGFLIPKGNTPTHVGKTAGRLTREMADRKHPHARGEDPGISMRIQKYRETPPRTWGRHLEFISFFPSYFQ